MILAILLGLVIGLALGSLGGGGSILAVPVLVHLAGQGAGAATATSLVAVAVASAAASVPHARSGNVRWGPAATFVGTGVLGSWVGTSLNGRLEDDVLLLAFSGLVLVAAHRMLTACPSCTRVGEALASSSVSTPAGQAGTTAPTATMLATRTRRAEPTTRSVGRVLLAGATVGLLTGLFGVGGGFVIVPALTLALGLSMPVAIGTSLVVIVGNALVALGFRGLDAVDWGVAIPFTATMLVGSVLGSLVADRLPPKASLRGFALLLVVVAVGNGIAAGAALVGQG